MSRLPATEIEICRRLKAFREGTRISRAQFAVAIGIGSERLASYESARAPVRYETFSKITQKFFLNPSWLAAGEESPALKGPFDDSGFRHQIRQRDLFSHVYESVLKKHLEDQRTKAAEMVDDAIATIARFIEMPKKVLKRLPKEKLDEFIKLTSKATEEMAAINKFEKRVESNLRSKNKSA